MSLHPVREYTPAEILAASSRPVPRSLELMTLVLAAIGAIVFIAGLFIAPDRAWRAFHANWLFWASLSVAGTVFVAVQRITTARWSRGIVRLLEGYVAFLPIAFVFLILIFLGRSHIFPWASGVYPNAEKAIYYNGVFVVARDLVAFGLITLLGLWYIYTSLRLDVGRPDVPESGAGWAAGLRARMRRGFRDERREIHSTHSLQGKLSVFYVILFGYGFSVLAWDLSMGLSIHFQSTLYSWWFFMGAWLCALMLFALLLLWWNRHLDGADGLIQEKHFHDLGKLCFAFTAFWGYLTFGQYLVIWYGNMAEETFFMRLRLVQPWMPVTVAASIMVFVIPFFGLISHAAKIFKPTFFLFSAISLVGMWLIRYIEVYPSTYGAVTVVPFGLWEIGVTLLYVGVWGWSYFAFYGAFPRMRVMLIASPFRDEVQIPCNPETMEPLPAHE